MTSAEDVAGHLGHMMAMLKRGEVVPFLGAGANVWGGDGDEWQPYARQRLPSGDELARYLAGEFGPPSGPFNLERVALDISISAGETALYGVLHEVFDGDYPPTRLHQLIARMPATLREKGWRALDVVVTTNYDDSLERAFQEVGVVYHVLSYIAPDDNHGRFAHYPPDGEMVVVDRSETYLMPEDADGRLEPTIIKLHGAIDRVAKDRDSFVITEDHYIEYLALGDIAARLPANVQQRLANSHFLFLGYSLADWNIRAVLHRLFNAQKADRHSWSIQLGVDPLQVKAWGQRRVHVLDIELGEYVTQLEAALDRLPPRLPPSADHG